MQEDILDDDFNKVPDLTNRDEGLTIEYGPYHVLKFCGNCGIERRYKSSNDWVCGNCGVNFLKNLTLFKEVTLRIKETKKPVNGFWARVLKYFGSEVHELVNQEYEAQNPEDQKLLDTFFNK